MPGWELSDLSLSDADVGEVVGVIALGAFQGPLEAVDLVAPGPKELILWTIGCLVR